MAVDSLQISAEAAAASQPEKPRGRPFRKGQSGNPAGRLRGSRNRKTLLMQQLLDEEAEALVRKVIDLALAGDPTALKLCIERVVAPRRDRAVEVELPSLRSAADLARVMGAVAQAAGEGHITPAEALALAQTVDTAMRAIETSEFDRRLRQLEEAEAKAEAVRPTARPAYAARPSYAEVMARNRGAAGY